VVVAERVDKARDQPVDDLVRGRCVLCLDPDRERPGGRGGLHPADEGLGFELRQTTRGSPADGVGRDQMQEIDDRRRQSACVASGADDRGVAPHHERQIGRKQRETFAKVNLGDPGHVATPVIASLRDDAEPRGAHGRAHHGRRGRQEAREQLAVELGQIEREPEAEVAKLRGKLVRDHGQLLVHHSCGRCGCRCLGLLITRDQGEREDGSAKHHRRSY